MLLHQLVPSGTALRVDALNLAPDAAHLTLVVTSLQPSAPCPLCQQPAHHVHSRYARTLADLPWATVAVRLRLQVRRFFCRVAACPRRIFTERLPTVVAPHARRTLRLTAQQGHIGMALGGAAGARLAATLTQP